MTVTGMMTAAETIIFAGKYLDVERGPVIQSKMEVVTVPQQGAMITTAGRVMCRSKCCH